MKPTKNVVLSILVFMATNLVYGQLPQTGLFFYSHDHNIDKRTSLILNNGEPYKLDAQENFTLEFDIFLRNELVKFGYIFRIISNKDENFDLVINNEANLFFVLNSQDFRLKNIPFLEKWNRVTLLFDKKQNIISLRFNDEIVDCPYDLESLQSLNISFGQCDFKNFLANDVPPFVLKDIQIAGNDRKIHRWTLDKHGVDVVYDELKNEPAITHNPYWLMDNHIYWKKVAEFNAGVFPQITFDSVNNTVYVLNHTDLIKYSLETDSTETFPNTRAMPPNEFYNRLLFDPLSGKLLYYGFKSDKINFYDFTKNAWSDYENFEEEADHAHHNRYISHNDSSLYLFGGYGHYKYNSDFFRVNLKTKERSAFDFSHTITPRYLAAMGGNRAGNKIYILGGRGAEMGRQELSPKNFSDLFEVDLKTNKVKYLFDINEEGDEGNVYSNSLVMDESDSCFYVLAYPNNKYSSAITLKKINLYTQEVTTPADTIEFYFRDVTSFCDLYFSPRLSKLIAVASYSEDQKTSQINLYTLEFPPLQLSDVIQKSPISSNKSILYMFIGSLCLLLLLFIFGRKLLSNGKKADAAFSNPEETDREEETINPEPQNEKTFYNFKTKAILFLGGFQVFDKEGKNITGEFTPTLKYILVLIVLYTLKNNKGISSSKLQELLWFDKSEEAARNNRSVNVRKLRVLLQAVGEIDITNENSYWTISLQDDILLDYKEVLRLIQKIQKDDTNRKDDLLRLLELLNSGVLLPNIQFEWVDNFKTDFSNAVIDALMHVVNNTKNSFYNQPDLRLKIADCILKIDPINEEALAIKCNALYVMGKKGLAKTAFDNFAKEYKLLLGEPYQGSIKNFIGQ
jgi:DNA-binding SARP family transcriptional activator